jgi:hypothetical protein
MDWVVGFREKLAVLMHVGSGQPVRGPQISSARHSNTVKKQQRMRLGYLWQQRRSTR